MNADKKAEALSDIKIAVQEAKMILICADIDRTPDAVVELAKMILQRCEHTR